MAKKDKQKYLTPRVLFDHEKEIELKLNTAWIEALQQASTFLILNFFEPKDLPKAFKKFDILIAAQGKEITDEDYLKDPIDGLEATLYTVWYLQRAFQAMAIGQGCTLKNDAKVTIEDFKEQIKKLETNPMEGWKNSEQLISLFKDKLNTLS